MQLLGRGEGEANIQVPGVGFAMIVLVEKNLGGNSIRIGPAPHVGDGGVVDRIEIEVGTDYILDAGQEPLMRTFFEIS